MYLSPVTWFRSRLSRRSIQVVDAPDFLNLYRAEIEAEVARAVPAEGTPLFEMVRYQLGWPDPRRPEGLPNLGKCLRPSLCLFACETLGGDRAQALPAAAGIELLHNFSLIHDDIEDGDELRHHRPTVWKAYGRDPAMLAGMILWTLAYQAIDRATETGVPPARVIAARRAVSRRGAER